MKLQKKLIIILLYFITFLGLSSNIFATDSVFVPKEYSDEYKAYLELSDEKKAEAMVPRMYDITCDDQQVVDNPIKVAFIATSPAENSSNYSLARDIQIKIGNQATTGSCWTFAAISSVETNLALRNKIRDFSERHVEYACSNINTKYGFNRNIDTGDGGSYTTKAGRSYSSFLTIPYFTSGTGPVDETYMPFESMELKIAESEIKGIPDTQVDDIVEFTNDLTINRDVLKKQIRTHIIQNGSVQVLIHAGDESCYSTEKGTLYCGDSCNEPTNHAVSIIGWDDNYSKTNFKVQPTNDGAWIIRNSWGDGNISMDAMKATIMQSLATQYKDDPSQLEQVCNSIGIQKTEFGEYDYKTIPDSVAKNTFQKAGYELTENGAYKKVANDGLLYVSYEDRNIYTMMTGIEKVSDKNYDNLYTYSPLGYSQAYLMREWDKYGYLATTFTTRSEEEYLTAVAFRSLNTTKVIGVYVNPNGSSKNIRGLEKAKLQAGDYEINPAGYHTIELAEPIEITGSEFTVVLELEQAEGKNLEVLVEKTQNSDIPSIELWKNVTNNPGKCFAAIGDDAKTEDEWADVVEGCGGDNVLQAFTKKEKEAVLEKIFVPEDCNYQKEYKVGESFNTSNLVVMAQYSDGTTRELSNNEYTIENGTNLTVDRTFIKIEYQGKTTQIPIIVTENKKATLKGIAITTDPTKKEYEVGENFDPAGMVVTASYSDNTFKTVSDYGVEDGYNLKVGQTSVNIKYVEENVEVSAKLEGIVVKETRTLQKLEVTTKPTKDTYYIGESFVKDGMVITGYYDNNTSETIRRYSILNGGPYQKAGQEVVVFSHDEKTAEYTITVEAANVTGIKVKTMPTKTKYLQGDGKIDLSGGVLEVSYSNNTTKDVAMTDSEVTNSGFDTSIIGEKTITVKYFNFTATFKITVEEVPEGPKNTDWTTAKTSIISVKSYKYEKIKKDDYILLELEISNVNRVLTNDSAEYFYYLSASQSDTDIVDWVRISENQTDSNKLKFTINTKDLKNYQEVLDSNVLYLYIKESVKKNGQSSVVTTDGVKLTTSEVEKYVDDVKDGASKDPTESKDPYPFTGKIAIIVAVVALLGIGTYGYIKYSIIDK